MTEIIARSYHATPTPNANHPRQARSQHADHEPQNFLEFQLKNLTRATERTENAQTLRALLDFRDSDLYEPGQTIDTLSGKVDDEIIRLVKRLAWFK